ncbi:MurR/RpiR family transcriptional regulator [Clostridium sp. AL.422]|uniref:MurR/RpiR family transcriptional regulator n=1 Tax=Clostridium TaxID=1485 RepID=UPI00293DF33A|nr:MULTISPECIES: MurR/RpiR family transcriptional regulator [unclassified Clostridium]MDV4149899.1 MurR/RpiR family transcriptional regulator [Clostridium sp. AL.422]
MDKIGIINKLKEVYTQLKGSEKRTAEYILKNGKDIIGLSITELAERCDCSEATVFRVCQKIGCKGYQEFKIRIAHELIDPIENIHEDIEGDDNFITVMDKIFKSTIASLQETMKINNVKSLEEAADILEKANEINFWGMGISGAVALDSYVKFIRTGKRLSYQSDSHIQAMIASTIKKDEVVVAISNSGSNKELIENVKIAKGNGAKIILLSSKTKSPLTRYADVTLIAYGREQYYRSEASDTRISTLVLLDCLFVQLCLKDRDKYYESLGKVRNAIAYKRL